MIRCSCGEVLTYETDICRACLPDGLVLTRPTPNEKIERMIRAIMDHELAVFGDHCLAIQLRQIITKAMK